MKTQTKTTWRTVRLGDALAPKRGYIRGPFGSALRRPELQKSGIPVYEQQNAIYNHREFRFFIDGAKLKELKRFEVEGGDLIVSCSGTLGMVSFIRANDPKGIISQALLILRANKEEVMPEYLYHLFKSKRGKLILLGASHGSVQTNIAKREVVENIELNLPPLPIQENIVAILSAFDEKIENNSRMIKTLEEMVEVIFKERFDILPEDLPRGWEVKNVLEVVKRIPGGKKYENKTALLTGKVPILDQGQSGCIGYHNDEPGVVASVDEPVVVFTNHTCNYRLITYPFSAIQNVLPYIGTNGYPTLFAYYLTRGKITMQEYKGYWPEFEQQDFVVPPPALAEEFASFIKPMVQKMVEAENENKKLAAMRDLLLPRLMSGEIQV